MVVNHFAVESIPDLVNKLTAVQKALFDEIWNHFVESGTPFPTRSIPRIIRKIGKQTIQEAFNGLNGSLVYEGQEQGNSCYYLTAYGAFLTGHGNILVGLLIRLLDLVKELYEENSLITSIEGSLIKERLRLSDEELKLMSYLLRLRLPPSMPFYSSGYGVDGSWTLVITDDVMALYQADDSASYLNERLSAGYKPDEPYLYLDRLRYTSNPLPSASVVTNDQDVENTALPNAYITHWRIEELRRIKSAQFDCTRLICMCEELNECASRGNAHAVIMLTRAILDHVPPVFGLKNFKEVSSNYGGGGSSFKKSAERLENQTKRVADRLLHMQIRDKEIAPDMHEVSFSQELEMLLAEFCRLLK